MCIGGSVEIDMYPYIAYAGPLYFYPREGGVMKTLMNNRQVSSLNINTYIYMYICTDIL